jgi:hypothetical protein
VAGDASFLVEEFINAITTQLDRVQDALRIKSVNRPLTYALRDLTLDLKVFVEMDNQGNVRFRASGPNEEGSSVVKLGFTTITRPMIEENTISMAAARSTPLDELGLSPEEKNKLERVGVSNVAQLERLNQSAGTKAVARLSDVSIERLRHAITQGQPALRGVVAVPQPASPPRTAAPVTPPDATAPTPPPKRPAPVAQPRPGPPARFKPELARIPASPGVIRREPGTRKLRLLGQNLLNQEELPEVLLNNRRLSVTAADQDHLEIEIPQEGESGTLEVHMPDGEVHSFTLGAAPAEMDPWSPQENAQ